jgi:hypothetical protein
MENGRIFQLFGAPFHIKKSLIGANLEWIFKAPFLKLLFLNPEKTFNFTSHITF